MLELIAVLFISVTLSSEVALGLRGGIRLKEARLAQAARLRVISDHLIDCVQNPQLAELFGGAKSDACLQTRMGLFSGVGGLFNQAITIGVLVMSYFFFKRSANGVIDWIDTEVDEEDILYNSVRGRDGAIDCPKCAGTGKFTWDADDPSSSDLCEICNGTGKIDRPLAKMRRGGREDFELPRATRENEDL